MNKNRCKQVSKMALLGMTFLTSFSSFSQLPKSDLLAKIKIVIAKQVLIVNLNDTPASRQLLEQLPLTLDFTDYARAEKIAYLPQKLTTKDMQSAAHISGDFTYYAPWGNLAIFYQGMGHDSHLYTLGNIESGKDILAKVGTSFTATISLVESDF